MSLDAFNCLNKRENKERERERVKKNLIINELILIKFHKEYSSF